MIISRLLLKKRWSGELNKLRFLKRGNSLNHPNGKYGFMVQFVEINVVNITGCFDNLTSPPLHLMSQSYKARFYQKGVIYLY